jgi:hypothetical protein
MVSGATGSSVIKKMGLEFQGRIKRMDTGDNIRVVTGLLVVLRTGREHVAIRAEPTVHQLWRYGTIRPWH